MSESSEKSIFLEALDCESPESREQFLTNACDGNPELKASVESLLNAHNRQDHAIDQPAADWRPANGDLLEDTLISETPISEDEGSMIGPYRLMEQIGEGGFGLVFVAQQQQPVKRQVALKILKPGMDTREVVARFEAERQALAMMDHPNIAAVFDAGTTDTGRPYFVMELVRGIAITDFCDQHKLNVESRLKLFVTVCKALQHAHQKGVIHRDIKPSNVLVASHDGSPVVKVIDFGIAKAIGQRLTEKTIYTRFTAMIGTPLYMSPEQAEMSGLDVDTRSDIYSLGVLLYELLTGTTPFDKRRLGEATYDELRQIIREEEPPRPSDRLTTLGKQDSTLATASNPRSDNLHRIVKGDLDWIAMKAMEKDRQRRYGSVGELAADVECYLNDDPISARPPSRVYRVTKFAKRNKAMLVTVSLVMASLVLGTTVSLWQAANAIGERNDKDKALQKAVKAQNEAASAKQQIEEFAERLKKANILVTSGRAHADTGRLAAAYTDYSTAISVQPNYYNAWLERASLQVQVGLWQPAATDFAEALKLGVPPDNPANWGIAQLFLLTGDTESYLNYCKSMLELRQHDSTQATLSEIRSYVISQEPIVDPVTLASQAEELLAVAIARPARGFRGFEGRGQGGRGDGARGRDGRRFPGPPGDPRDQRGGPAGGERFDRPGTEPSEPRPRESGVQTGPPNKTQGPPRRGDGFEGPDHGRPGMSRGGAGQRNNFGNFQVIHPVGAASYITGLAHYRAEQYELAIQRFQEALNSVDWSARDITYPALAMAFHRNGQAEEARTAFQSSKEWLNRWTEDMLNNAIGDTPFPWFDLIEAKLLHAEASLMLTGFIPAEDPRLRELEDRAYSALRE